ncbi:MAG TPA: phospholipid carrier-dependent glycosyltransferase [Candidatus Acidoferrales bacterium]|nr:phospholipid carrier-dependent glycosyltransferase [Candidatus Acidoferrales bacterium]
MVIIFLLAVSLFAGLGSIGLVGPDEPRYASVAREMARTGDWLTPLLNGRPWFEKPALYYWSAAAAFDLLGVNERAARLPAALAALAGALLLAWAARRFYGASAALLALLLFPTSVGLFAFAHAASMDMLLAVALEAAMVAALTVLFEPGNSMPSPGARRWRLALVGGAIGLGTLAKGPVAIVLAGGSVLLWAGVARRWRDGLLFLGPVPVAAFAVVALPWYVLCSLVNPGFVHTFLWFHNVQRFLTPVFEHAQPWWFFGPVLALGLAPWTPVLLATARDGAEVFRSGRAARAPGVFVACWAAFPLLFFSFSQSKLPGYILPALPPLVLLVARTIDRADRAGDRLSRMALALVGATWIALAATAGHWLHRLPQTWDIAHRQTILGLLVASGILGIAVAGLALAKRARPALLASALWMGILVGAVCWLFLPQLDPYLSARDAARAAESVAGQNAAIETYRLPRDWQYGLNYYFDRELGEWSPAEYGWRLVYTTPRNVSALAAGGRRVTRTAGLRGGLVLAQVAPSGSDGSMF